MTFPFVPSYATSGDRSFDVRSVAYGDGYVQRAKSGINNAPLKFSVVFKNRSDEEFAAIETWLAAMAGVTAFEWNPPPPFNHADVDAWSGAVAYTAGMRAEVSDSVFVALESNTGENPVGSTKWAFAVKLPMKFVCTRGSFSLDDFNVNSLTSVFEQTFAP